MERKSISLAYFLELPDYVTLVGGACSLLGAWAAVRQQFWLAALLLLLSVPCDYFDGKVARARGRRHPKFGEALDTVVDAVSFAAVPVVFGYCLGLQHPLQVLILLLFAGAAVLRLARFTVLPADPKAFVGMPVTYNNLILPGAYLLAASWLPPSWSNTLLTGLYLLCAWLMGSTIRWKKF